MVVVVIIVAGVIVVAATVRVIGDVVGVVADGPTAAIVTTIAGDAVVTHV